MTTNTLVCGATGRIGRILQMAWAQRQGVLWQARGEMTGPWLQWDILSAPWPGLRLPGVVIFGLAGVVRGDEEALAQNTTLALAMCEAALRCGAAHVFLASSVAVYGSGQGEAVPVDEDAPPAPMGAYGHAKAMMETAVLDWQARQGAGVPGLTVLRIGNVLGADALFGAAASGRAVTLDPVHGSDAGPQRAYIGPGRLAAVLAGLADLARAGQPLPKLLNISAPGQVRMGDLLDAAGFCWQFGPDNPQVLAGLPINTQRLEALLPGVAGRGEAADLVADWRDFGAEHT
ncbi:Nucleoside-diphosphate-sugar epimerase [Gemmobacter aquatilis]|uniref:Nucleoside-diphosphate-sugar epimerase n=1 Tax=Gemmobacter aquatilis TaxID=933059 RepID=A0A1H7YQE3_9RHOB|nr:NAD-dependent epimerase/dehydratase family protein [Gemmobacter aquatilis]SEM47528.1 Nucleoside-diphosphate-sugar epimerase [Gemmobacter aquatilis]